MNNRLIFGINNLDKEGINYNNQIQNKEYFISNSIIEQLLKNKKNFKKFITVLYDKETTQISIYNFFNKLMEINKIDLLKMILMYIEQKDVVDIDVYQILKEVQKDFNYDCNINKNDYYRVEIDNILYFIPVKTCLDFLTLNELEFTNIILNEKSYKNIKLEVLIYSLIDYFETNNLFTKYIFPYNIIKRFVDLKNNKYIDIESMNRCLETKDILLSQVNLNKDLLDVMNKKYDFNTLNNIIKVYVELCNMLVYDEKYYFDEAGNFDVYNKHGDLYHLSKINKDNNKILCFEFTEILGYFLNSIGIKYEVVGNQNHYGFAHSYIVFRYDKFLIKIEPVLNLFDNDLTNAKTNQRLIGITCINKNENTKKEFNNILSYCYQAKPIKYDGYLPYNKIENSMELDDKKRSVVNRIDLVLKKIDNDRLGSLDKGAYLKVLMDNTFTQYELENNISYCIVTNYFDLVYIFTINNKNYNNSDNLYLIYKDNKLSFIDKDTLIYMFEHCLLAYLNKKEIPGLQNNNKKIKKGIRK